MDGSIVFYLHTNFFFQSLKVGSHTQKSLIKSCKLILIITKYDGKEKELADEKRMASFSMNWKKGKENNNCNKGPKKDA